MSVNPYLDVSLAPYSVFSPVLTLRVGGFYQVLIEMAISCVK